MNNYYLCEITFTKLGIKYVNTNKRGFDAPLLPDYEQVTGVIVHHLSCIITYLEGSCSRSMNWAAVFSILKITLSKLDTNRL